MTHDLITSRPGRRSVRMLFAIAALWMTLIVNADDVVVEQNVMVPMRDGTLLATDVYHPAVDGKVIGERLPLLLTRTPYSKSRESSVATAMHLAKHGYVAVVQDMRGVYESQGVFSKYSVIEPEDGYDTVEWLAKQDWSDG
ncbi:MAG: CocE/NonD family hydrolase, partial [Woeseia sp.]|nr:CocE/NonD family hydrolase [Woeseia sp.]